VFALPGSDLEMQLDHAGVPVDATYGGDIVDPADIADFTGRVAMKPSCFAARSSALPRLGNCRYLDSQAALEAALPKDAIVRTDVTVTCPVVSVNGMAVAP